MPCTSRCTTGRWTVALIVCMMTVACSGGSQSAAPPTAPPPAPGAATGSAGTQVVFLGTGTPLPDPDRSGPATAVVVNGAAYLFDAGAGVVRRAMQARRAGIAALDSVNLRTVFLTHLHSDHTMGLPDLILTPWVIGRQAPLDLYGPVGSATMVSGILAGWSGTNCGDSGSEAEALSEMRKFYDGQVVEAHDLDVF